MVVDVVVVVVVSMFSKLFVSYSDSKINNSYLLASALQYLSPVSDTTNTTEHKNVSR